MLFLPLLVPVLIYLLLLIHARRSGPLKPWHDPLKGEFRARDGSMDLAGYLALERGLFERLSVLEARTSAEDAHRYSRYYAQSASNPRNYGYGLPKGCSSWNRTFIMEPKGDEKGGVLLLHGLTDAPYSVRAIAETLRDQGYYVLGLRVPGHGLQPGGLLSVTMEDWIAATHLAAGHLVGHIGEKPFYMGGYSNGGALTLAYTLDAMTDENLRAPDRIFLFSPEIGVNPLAEVTNWHKIYSWLPGLSFFKWLGIEPEYDPFKYNSFAKNAADQAWRITKRNKKKVEALAKDGKMGNMPPILAFQSVVDTTIEANSLIEDLFDRLAAGNHELVLIDLNRYGAYDDFFKAESKAILERLEISGKTPENYKLTVITNAAPDTCMAVARTRLPGSSAYQDPPVVLKNAWPEFVYSQSHVSIPFRPNDPLYGDGTNPEFPINPLWDPEGPDDQGYPALHLGSLNPRGEKQMLSISLDALMRLRHNIFFDYLAERLIYAVAGTPPQDKNE